MLAPKVYSYLRFSDPKQAKGTSAERQLEYAVRWAAEHGMQLDASLTLRDEGLSAYHQRHIKQGALGAFLRAIEEGRITPGSVLIVEGLDRLSRAEPIIAQGQLAQIINAGVTVITAADGREYNFERLKAQPMDLVYSLLVMIRAHEESDTKARRVKAAIRKQCEGWLAGTYRGPVGSPRTDPAWVEYVQGKGCEIRPERALAVRTMIDLFKQGYGAVRIVEMLNERSLSISGGPNGVDRVHQIIGKRTLIGEKTIDVDGQTYVLPGYYPALLTEQEFSELQYLISQRGRRPGKGELPALFTGLGIAQCGYCGAALVSQNGMRKNRQANGLPHDGHRRLVCTGYKGPHKCCVAGSCSVVPIERALMRYCSDQMNLNRLVEGDNGTAAYAAELAQARSRAAATDGQISKLMDAMLADPDAMPAAFARKVRELEGRHNAELQEVDRLEHELAVASTATPGVAQAWAELVEGVEALDHAARLKARQLAADTFSRIVIYRRGFELTNSDGSFIDLLLIAKHGNTRMLHVDRRTGAWKAAEDLDLSGIASHDVPVPPGATIV